MVARIPTLKTWHHVGRSRCASSLRLAVVVLVGLAAFSPTGALVAAESDSMSAEDAAREIRAARDRANEAADAYFEAQSVMAGLEDNLARLEDEAATLEKSVEKMEQQVALAAAQRFVRAGSSGIPILTEIDAPSDHAQEEVFVGLAANDGLAVLDQYAQLVTDLEQNSADLADQRDAVEDQQQELEDLQAAAEAEVERLREVERERLTDEAVERSLAAQLAVERARIEEQARIAVEAAARAAPNPGLSDSAIAPPTTVTTTPDAAQGDAPVENPAPAAPVEAAPPTTFTPTNEGASGGTSGGRTGVSGPGSTPAGIDVGEGYIDVISCPILGSAYGNTWGAPRSGGRRHQGVDMIAPGGVPIYAVTSGYVTFKQNRLGGNAASLMGDNGNRYYFAHFSRYEGTSRRVVAGEVIGYNGKTGNTTTNHLHFELRPGAGLNVNPYPSVRFAGC